MKKEAIVIQGGNNPEKDSGHPGSLLVVQGIDGVEQGRLVGGIETEEDPYEAGKAEGHEDGQRGNDGCPAGQGRKDLRP